MSIDLSPRDLDLLPTEDAEDLRATVRAVLQDHSRHEAVLALYDGSREVVAPVWRALAVDLGLAGLLVPEEHGGHAASAREAAVVLEELGAAVAPVPFLTSAVVATTLLAGSPSAGAMLASLASGERTAVLVVPWSTDASSVPALTASGGTVRNVAGALEADVLLVPTSSSRGVQVVAVSATSASVEPVVSLDMSRQVADVTLTADALEVADVVVSEAADPLARALTTGAALLASEQVGIARWCLTETVAYLRDRRQFGRPVGGFQALKHRLADLYVEVESAAAAAAWAAATVAESDDPVEVALASSVAAAYCADAALGAAEETVQLHGGIAMTWEHPAHLYLKRAQGDLVALGTPSAHRTAVAGLADLTGTDR